MNYKTAFPLDLLLACNTLMNIPLQGVLWSAGLAVWWHSPHPDTDSSQGGEKKSENSFGITGQGYAAGGKSHGAAKELSDSTRLTSLLKSLLFRGMVPNRKHFWKLVPSLEFHFLPKSLTHSSALDSQHGSRFLLPLLLTAEKPQPEPFTHFFSPKSEYLLYLYIFLTAFCKFGLWLTGLPRWELSSTAGSRTAEHSSGHSCGNLTDPRPEN